MDKCYQLSVSHSIWLKNIFFFKIFFSFFLAYSILILEGNKLMLYGFTIQM